MIPGDQSSEWRKAQRAELLGFILVALGAALALYDPNRAFAGAAFAAVGAHLVAHTAAAYAQARGSVKAAAVRRPADTALPRGL